MKILAENIKLLRKKSGLTQAELALKLGISRGLVTAYEQDRATPPVPAMLALSEYFNVDIDSLVKSDLKSSLPKNSKTREILAITVDTSGNENVELVNQRASAGYLNGYQDQVYLTELPKLHLPFLSKNRTHRAFEISGDSMLPVKPHSIIIAEYVEDMKDIKNGDSYIVVTKTEGISFKRVYSILTDVNKILLVSDNTIYQPYTIGMDNVIELWKKKKIISDEVETENLISGGQLAAMVINMQEQLNKLNRKR